MSPLVLRRIFKAQRVSFLFRKRFDLKDLSNIYQKRCFFGFDGCSTKEFSETKVIGYSMEQFYDVIANVDDYKYFVPWCVASRTFQKSETYARADLEVGFPPISEKYSSILTLARPNLVKSECMDGTLFNHLVCNWRLSEGPKEIANSCTLNFYLSFEFKSVLHSQLSDMFFDEVVRKMVSAFESRSQTLYGPSSLISTKYDPKKRLQTSRKNKKIVRKGS
ncbi:coenzyme Q-binding protein COQ10 homolog A, mitochondrial-like isoform X2 [Hydractinia symbiolongicarpus]|uniref:coenzyme Q-binding protein COQ10 homolog A, mitochondrial-like isoform X2 n=1 Tax=Hydractinia symbiolongicarpus TaxID=13093 RepID=UPI0025511C7D|nr:coenzyme Q-binding protein COQ10 homolog A, mitochondrial-like isoform X2 [Hydractinia symbiolongicarpus]